MNGTSTIARSTTLQGLVTYWQMLTPDAVKRIADVYAEDAYFRDPFNEATGLAAIKHIFADMFVRLHDPRFTIIETIEQENSATLIWDFDFRVKALKPSLARRIHGSSHVRFGADGRVNYHRDYWDTAGELYEQLPLVGALMRWLKRRMG